MNHTECMVYCVFKDSTLTYVDFEQREVETFGKGQPFSRMEKVETELSYDAFILKFRCVKRCKLKDNIVMYSI